MLTAEQEPSENKDLDYLPVIENRYRNFYFSHGIFVTRLNSPKVCF